MGYPVEKSDPSILPTSVYVYKQYFAAGLTSVQNYFWTPNFESPKCPSVKKVAKIENNTAWFRKLSNFS